MKLRKVLIKSEAIKSNEMEKPNVIEGYFHCWAGLSEWPIAVVELDNGEIVTVEYWGVQFISQSPERSF